LSTLPDGNVAKKALKYGTRNDDFGGEWGLGDLGLLGLASGK
jgi:hypothetical protein